MFFTDQVVGGVGQGGGHKGYPAEYRPMTAAEHRLCTHKLRADTLEIATLKAMNSQHLQQKLVEYERKTQVLHAALEAQKEAEAAGDRRSEEAPATPSLRVEVRQAANAQLSSPPGLPSDTLGAQMIPHPGVQ